MSRERDKWRKYVSGNEKRKQTKKKEEFNASLKGSFDKFVTKISDPARPAAGPRVVVETTQNDDLEEAEAGEGSSSTGHFWISF